MIDLKRITLVRTKERCLAEGKLHLVDAAALCAGFPLTSVLYDNECFNRLEFSVVGFASTVNDFMDDSIRHHMLFPFVERIANSRDGGVPDGHMSRRYLFMCKEIDKLIRAYLIDTNLASLTYMWMDREFRLVCERANNFHHEPKRFFWDHCLSILDRALEIPHTADHFIKLERA